MKKNNSKKSSVDRSTKGLDESQSANGEEGQGCRKTIREGEGYDVVATSPLHTLATAAAYKSPTPVHEPQNGTLSSSTNGYVFDLLDHTVYMYSWQGSFRRRRESYNMPMNSWSDSISLYNHVVILQLVRFFITTFKYFNPHLSYCTLLCTLLELAQQVQVEFICSM